MHKVCTKYAQKNAILPILGTFNNLNPPVIMPYKETTSKRHTPCRGSRVCACLRAPKRAQNTRAHNACIRADAKRAHSAGAWSMVKSRKNRPKNTKKIVCRFYSYGIYPTPPKNFFPKNRHFYAVNLLTH